jgi:hypothetical protein
MLGSYLYSRSPSDLLKFKTPFTLFSSTNPPALSILFYSVGRSGLWSILISIAFPSLLKTHRESPAFAQIISVSVIMATHAVHPVYNAILSDSGLPNSDD